MIEVFLARRRPGRRRYMRLRSSRCCETTSRCAFCFATTCEFWISTPRSVSTLPQLAVTIRTSVRECHVSFSCFSSGSIARASSPLQRSSGLGNLSEWASSSARIDSWPLRQTGESLAVQRHLDFGPQSMCGEHRCEYCRQVPAALLWETCSGVTPPPVFDRWSRPCPIPLAPGSDPRRVQPGSSLATGVGRGPGTWVL